MAKQPWIKKGRASRRVGEIAGVPRARVRHVIQLQRLPDFIKVCRSLSADGSCFLLEVAGSTSLPLDLAHLWMLTMCSLGVRKCASARSRQLKRMVSFFLIRQKCASHLSQPGPPRKEPHSQAGSVWKVYRTQEPSSYQRMDSCFPQRRSSQKLLPELFAQKCSQEGSAKEGFPIAPFKEEQHRHRRAKRQPFMSLPAYGLHAG